MFLLPSSRPAFAGGLGALVALCWSAVAAGTAIELNPVRLTLSHAQPVAALTVRNASEEPVVLQLKTVAWTQEDGEDRYTPSRELLATPPIFPLAPGASQTVRVGLRHAPDAQRELAYRLYLREVPGAAPDGTGVRISLRLGVPVFVSPLADAAAPRLRWRLEHAPDGVWLHARNEGNAHVRVTQFSLAADGEMPVVHGDPAYILPGRGRRWRLELPASAGKTAILQVHTNAGKHHDSLVLD